MDNKKIQNMENNRFLYQEQLQNAQNQYKEFKQSYDALCRFNRIVEKSQNDFFSVNSRKKSFLADIDRVKKNSLIAQTYSKGISLVLAGVGTKLIGIVYKWLLRAISLKKKNYFSKMSDCEKTINSCRYSIDSISKNILEEKKRGESK